MKKIIALTAIFASLSACASQPSQIAPSRIAHGTHDNLSCKEINKRLYMTQTTLGQLSAAQKAEADKDAAWVAGGALLFFPAMVVAAAGEDYSGDIARLKGDEISLTSSKMLKSC